MDLNPLHDQVVVRVLEAEGRSAGGIVIPVVVIIEHAAITS